MRAVIKCGEIERNQIGGRGQWPVEVVKLEEYTERMSEHQNDSSGFTRCVHELTLFFANAHAQLISCP